MYFPWNWEFGSALSKFRTSGGFEPPKPPSLGMPLTGCNIMQQQQSIISEIAGQVRPSVWNTPLNSKGVLEHVADLHRFSAFVAHSCAEAAVILGH
jgi:hypothetical protein